MPVAAQRPASALLGQIQARWLKEPTRHFIDNQWVENATSQTFDVVNPATEEKLATCPNGGKAEIDRAVKAARKAFESGPYSRWSGRDRGNFLRRLADLIEKHAEELAVLECLNNGKPIGELRAVDLPLTVQTLHYYAGWADKIHGETIHPPGNFFVYTRREPMGVCGSITAWNFPLVLISWKFGPAIAAGNALVHKPPEQAPLSALRFAELVREAGLPEGVFNVVTGLGETAGEALTRHMDVDKVGFTGHYQTGQLVMKAAAESNLKRVSLELGGKSPNIVLDDADLEAAVQGTLTGIFFNQGEVCCAGSRLFLPKKLHDPFLDRLAGAAESRRVGDPLDPGTEQGAQISKEQFEKILGYIEKGKAEGAKVVAGGKRCGDRGYFVRPTVFDGVQDGMTIAREEIFGPVVSVLPYDTLEDVARRANATNYGLGAAVFTQDLSKAHKLAGMLKSGTVWINCYNAFDASVPFGGYKMSGFGRELGQHALELYTQTKAVWVNLGG
ncbi:MAG: aldehyde dehydrogenase family protein [Planctomycetota bacterium]|nr:aldehyde dehydrogenase family protein [Planctomycetota bacterium]